MENPTENGDINASVQEPNKLNTVEAEKFKNEANVFFNSNFFYFTKKNIFYPFYSDYQ